MVVTVLCEKGQPWGFRTDGQREIEGLRRPDGIQESGKKITFMVEVCRAKLKDGCGDPSLELRPVLVPYLQIIDLEISLKYNF